MKLERNVLKVEIYGRQFELRSPTVKMVREAQAHMKEEDSGFEKIIKILSEIGVDEDFLLEMEIEHVQLLCDELFVKKK